MNKQLAALILLLGTTVAAEPPRAAVVAETHRLDEPPYYVDVVRSGRRSARCAVVLPVTLDPEMAHAFGYTDRAREFEPLLAALNRRIAAMQGCARGIGEQPAADGAPRVYVGSAESEYAPADVGDQRVPGDRFAPMVLHLARPGSEWRQEVGALLESHEAQYAVAIQLSVSQYMKGYSGPFNKEVVLGTGHREPVKFLTAEDKPVEVLHLTGVLVDSQGKVLRAGAEGIMLRDTPFPAQVVDAVRLFDPQEIERIVDVERRADLPGAPLKIDVALDNLVQQLAAPH